MRRFLWGALALIVLAGCQLPMVAELKSPLDAKSPSFVPKSADKNLLTFSLEPGPIGNPAKTVSGKITEATTASQDNVVELTLPFGSTRDKLVATFTFSAGATVKIGTVAQVSATTVNDFTNPLSYIVTAADGTTKTYKVTAVIAKSDQKDITAFSFVPKAGTNNPTTETITVTPDQTAKTITVTLPFNSVKNNLVATFSTSGSKVEVGTVEQISGTTANDFTNAVTYKVTAADGTDKVYTVTVSVAASSAKEITEFKFVPTAMTNNPSTTISGRIVGTDIFVDLPSGSLTNNLVATFSTTGSAITVAGVNQVSGTTPNSFASSLSYIVTAADSSTRTYVVSAKPKMTVVYVQSAMGSSFIDSFILNTSTGVLGPKIGGTFTNTDAPSQRLVVSPNGKFLIHGNTASNMKLFGVTAGTGALVSASMPSPALTASLVSSTKNPAIDPLGRFMYVLQQTGLPGGAVQFPLDSTTGMPSVGSNLTVGNGVNPPGGMVFSPNGKFAFVYEDMMATGKLQAYMVGSDGSLSVQGATFEWTAGKMKGVVVDPTGQYLYVAQDNGPEMKAFSINQTNGALTLVEAAAMAPSPAGGYIQVGIDPSGQFVVAIASVPTETIYVAKRNTSGSDALQTAQTYTLTGAGPPISFTFSKDGHKIYVNYDTGNLEVLDWAYATSGAMSLVELKTGIGLDFTIDPTGKYGLAFDGGVLKAWPLAANGSISSPSSNQSPTGTTFQYLSVAEIPAQ